MNFTKTGDVDSCPCVCKCKQAQRHTPDWEGKRNIQSNGYCYHWCGIKGICQITEEAQIYGKDCRGCRGKYNT